VADPVLQRNDNGPSVAEAQNLLNRTGAILDPDGAFGGGTDSAVRQFQAAMGLLPVTGVIDAATWQALRALPEPSPDIPTRAVAFIAREEVGDRNQYDAASRPTWPGGASGVTIGVGYDLGYQSDFDADWSDLLTPEQVAALRPCLGLKGAAASAAIAALAGISIPWRAAWTAFIRRTLPQEVSKTRNTFVGHTMAPLCFGVLVSLVYNRGAGMTDSQQHPGDRQEMRDIRDAVAAGRLQDIPAALRRMKRLWPDTSGLVARREREAQLFEQGLAQA
jgi:peptidoglycan hydrolase-like protein with peptidoglycan-binding domain